MAYMAQQWLATAARNAYRARPDAGEQADEAARVKAWLRTLDLDRAAIAALLEPIDALEDGLRQAANDGAPRTARSPDLGPKGSSRPGRARQGSMPRGHGCSGRSA